MDFFLCFFFCVVEVLLRWCGDLDRMSREVSFLIPNEENGNKRIQAVLYGQRDAAARGSVFCLHGFQDNANSFYFLAPRLAAAGFFVVCIDFTGHGHSDHSSAAGDHFSYIYDLVDVADSLQIPQFHLIGHSMGGIVAMFAASSLVTRVLSLVILDAIGAIGIQSEEEAPLLLEKALAQRSAILLRKGRVYDSLQECVERWKESPFAPRGEHNVRLIVERGTEEIVDVANNFVSGYRFRHDPRLKSPTAVRLTEATVEAFVRRISCPTLMVLATDRPQIWPEHVEQRRVELLKPVMEVARMTGGHHLHMTNVDEVYATLATFYDRVVKKGAKETPKQKSKL